MPLRLPANPAGRRRNTFLFFSLIREKGRYARIGVSLLLCLLPLFAQAQSWYNTSWQYRKAIIIDKSKVISGSHTNFPVLISLTDAGLKASAQSSGNDILFTSSNGTTKLAHEIERYTSSTGELVAWVEIPSLSSASNTVLYMYYGNASAGSQQSVSATWSANYLGVYHFNNSLNDASGNARNGTNSGSTNTTGKIGYGRNLSSTAYITISGLMGNPQTGTLSGWVYVTAYDASGAGLISLGDHCAIRLSSTDAKGFYYNGSTWPNTTGGTDYSGAWHYVCYAFASGSSSQKLYVDGAQVGSTSYSGSISYSGLGSNTLIGKHGNGNTGMDLTGQVDEIRVASAMRSAGWIQTEFNNQSDPASFFTVGNCETQAPAVTTPIAYCQNAAAAQLSASGSNLLWGSGSVIGSGGGSSTLSATTFVDAGYSNQKTLFSTLAANVVVTSVDYYIPAWQSVSGLQLAIFNSSGTAVAVSSTVTSQSGTSSSTKVTNVFNAVLSTAGSYSIGIYSGSGNIGGDAPGFPINESTGTLRVTGKSGSYRCFNNIQFNAGGSTTAPTPSTAAAGSTNYTVLQAPGGCASTSSTITVNVTGTVATPSFSMGSTSSRCMAAGSITYTATAANSTGITYSLDATSLAAGNTINSSTGQVTYASTWSGISTITATATGCSGPKSATHRATTTSLNASATSTRTCVGGSTGTLTVTASGGTAPYTYSSDGGSSYQSGNTFSGLAAGSYSIYVKSSTGCLGSTSATISPYDTATSSQNVAGSNVWIGHVYDGTNFSAYYGTINEAETFNEGFGGSTNCLAVQSGTDTSYVYTETFSVRYRMNTTRRGLYAVDLGSDDGSRLTVDGTMVYNNWSDQSFSTKANVLMSLTGSSSLLYEFYENGGGNQVIFQNLTQVIANTLSGNTSQSLCIGSTGAAISGDTLGPLPTGISLSGTGYQWTYSTTPGGARINISGATAATFTPAASAAPFNTPGTYYVYRNVSLSSANNISPNPFVASNESNAATITVNASPSATISYGGSPYCGSSGTAGVTRTGTAGGSYSSRAGLSIDASTGAINLSASAAGAYTVTYTVNVAGCTSYATTATAQVFKLSNNTIDYTNGTHGSMCDSVIENATATLTAPSGAVFINVGFASYGTPGGSCPNFTTGSCHASTSQAVAESYLLGKSSAAIPATNAVFGDPCQGTYKAFAVQATYTQPLCAGSNAGTIVGTAPSGGNGTYTYLWESSTTGPASGFSPASGTNNAKDYSPGALSQTTWFRRTVSSGGCSTVSTVLQITVSPAPSATISYAGSPYCNSSGTATVTRTGTAGGIFSSTAGLSIDAGTGAVNLAASTPGTYTVTYTVAAAGGCAVYTTTASITVTDQPATDAYYPASPYCSNGGTVYPTATILKGAVGSLTYTSGLVIDAYAGVNLAASTPGNHTVTYTVPASGGCAQYVHNMGLTISAAPSAMISYAGSPYCSNAGTAAVTFSGTSGGTFSSTAGISINASTGAVNLASSTPGTYTVTYTVAASGGCSLYQITAPIVITAMPSATISYSSSPYCSSSGTATVTRTGTAGGKFSAAAGLSIDSTTGAVNLGASTPGTYTVTYSVPAGGGCGAFSTTASITVTEQPAINGYYAGSPYCSNAGTAYPTIVLVKGAPGTMSYTPGLVVDPYGGVNLAASTPGTHTLTYTVAAGGGCAQYVFDTGLTITTAPSASISYPGSPYLSYGGTANVVLTGTTGGSFSAGAGLSINATTGAINLAASTPGTYTVTYSIAAAGGCGAFSTTASVTVVQRNLFRSIASGAWNQSSTWELSTNGGASWAPSAITPTSNTDTVTISSNHIVTVPGNISPSLLRVSANATLAPDSTIFIAGTGTLNGAGTVQATMQGKDFSTQFSISNKDLNALTVDYAAKGAQLVSPLSYYRVIVSNTAAAVAPQGNFSVSDTLNVMAGAVLSGGSFTVSGAGVLSGNGTVQVKATGNAGGDFAAQFPILRKQLTNLTVEFAGAARQMLDTIGFAKLTINNAAGLQLAGDARVDTMLTFSNGLLILNTNNLTLGATISIGGMPSAASMVVTNGSGELRKKMTALGSFVFPVGDNTGTPEYSPATLTQTSGSFPANAYLSVRVVNAKHPANNAKANYLNRYWVVSRAGLSGNCTGIFQYLPADVVGSESQIYLGRYTPGVAALWTTLTLASASDQTLTAAAYNGAADYTGTDRSCGVYNYRSRANGSWSSKNTWEASIDGGATWFNGGSYPATDFDTVRIQAPYTVTGNLSLNPSLVIVDSGGVLNPSSGAIYGGTGILKGSGTIRVSRTTGVNEFFTQYAIANLDVSGMTVEYTGNAAQDVGATVYGTLFIKGTGLKTLQSGTASMKDLAIDTPSSFTVKGTLQVAGAIANAGTLNVAAATVEMNGSAAQTVPANTFSGHLVQNFIANNNAGISLNDTMLLSGIMKAVKGNFNANGLLTLTSDKNGTALIDGSGAGNVNGLVTMQRYLPSGFGYRYISSPFTAAHVSQLSDDLNLADSFATLYRYDENVNHAGWIKYTDSSQTLLPLSGYAANFGTLKTPMTINISGVVSNGALSTLLYNHNQTYTLGFNLVGNPYPSPIDWNATSGWTKTNLDDAIYYFDNGTADRYQGAYSSFVNGVSSNGVASNVIASMQGFFVHVSNGSYPVNATLGLTNPVRVNNLLPVFHKELSSPSSLLRLSAGYEDVAGFSDPAVVYFDGGAQDAFERDKDAVKMLNTDERVPSLYSVACSQKLSINAQPFPGDLTQSIPLGIMLQRDGTVVFRKCDMVDMPAGLRVYFADAALGQIQDLAQAPEYKTALSKGSYENRFYLLFSREAQPVIPGAEALEAFMRGNSLVVTLRDDEGELSIVNALGQVQLRQHLSGKGMHEVSFSAAPGVYIVSLSTSQGQKSKKIFVGNQ